MYICNTGATMFNMVSRVLDGIHPKWKEKLIGITTDGASNMTGCTQGVVTRLENEAFPGLYRIWCGAHQLDLIIKNSLKTLLSKNFVKVMQKLIHFIHETKDIVDDVGNTCPRHVPTRWLTMGKVTQWLVKNIVVVLQYLEYHERPRECEYASDLHLVDYGNNPPAEWWIIMCALNRVLEVTNKTMKKLQYDQLSLDRQSQYLCTLKKKLMNLTGVGLSKDCSSTLPYRKIFLGEFFITAINADHTLYSVGNIHCNKLIDEIKSFKREKYIEVIDEVSNVYLSVIRGIHKLSPEQKIYKDLEHLKSTEKSEYAVIHKMSGCTPLALAEGHTPNFIQLVKEQYKRLQAFYSESNIHKLQEEYNDFHDMYNEGDGNFKKIVKGISEKKTFEEIWESLSKTYPMLVQFAGGLHSVFPGTPTVEGDFRNINIEKNENRQSLSIFSLEGILHAKQRKVLRNIETKLNKGEVHN